MKKIFMSIFGKSKNKFIILTVISLLLAAIGIVLPYLNGEFIDYLATGVGYSFILRMCIFILLLGLINVTLYYVKQILNAKIKLESSYLLKLEILKHLRDIPILSYKKFTPSYLNQRTEQDIGDIVSFIISNYPAIILNAIQIIGLFIIISRVSKGVVILMLIFLPVYYVMYVFLRKPLYTKSYASKEAHNLYFNTLNDQLAFMEEIKTNANYEYNNLYIDKYYRKYYRNYLEFVKISGKSISIEGIISALFQVATFLYGGWQVLNHNMSVGQLTVMCTYFSMMLQLIKYYFELGNSFQNVKTSLHRLEAIFHIEVEKEGNILLEKIENISASITFGYDSNNFILKELPLELCRGKIYCVVGKNGEGKSTLTKILIGILHAKSILVNGINIDCLNMEELRKNSILYISQALNYPNRTIKEIYQEYNSNIRLEDVIRKIKEHDLNEEQLIPLYQENWNKNINTLSGGEKQIVSILKCLVKEADMIIFDETTSNLDIKRINALLRLIERLKMEKKILLIVSHDSEIIQASDIIIRLGNIQH